LAYLPGKKVIWLAIILVLITIGVLWWVGVQTKKETNQKLQRATEEILTKQKNLETLVQSSVKDDNENLDRVITLPKAPSLKTSSQTDKDSLRQYGLNLTQALAPLSKPRENEIEATLAAIDKNDPNFIKSITQSRIYHDSAIENLSALTVPKEIASKHQDLIVSLEIVASLLRNMEKALSQPQLALTSSNLLATKDNDFLKNLEMINTWLAVRQISFTDEEKVKIFLSLP